MLKIYNPKTGRYEAEPIRKTPAKSQLEARVAKLETLVAQLLKTK